MRITINGEPREIPERLTITQLLESLGLDGPVAVERNRDIVPRVDHASVQLVEGDVLEIVHFVGGG